jgi:hypothetical protein
MQRWRERVRKNQQIYRVVADDRVLSMLIRNIYIEEREAEDDDEVAEAIALFLQDAAEEDEAKWLRQGPKERVIR